MTNIHILLETFNCLLLYNIANFNLLFRRFNFVFENKGCQKMRLKLQYQHCYSCLRFLIQTANEFQLARLNISPPYKIDRIVKNQDVKCQRNVYQNMCGKVFLKTSVG